MILLSLTFTVVSCNKKPQGPTVETPNTVAHDTINENVIIDQNAFDALYATFREEYDPEHRIPRHNLDQEAFRNLIQSGMNVNVRNEQGQTLLMVATNPDVMKALIEAGIDVNAKDNHGMTALMNIAESTHCVDNDPDEVFEDNDGEIIENKDCMDVLIAAGADVNLKDNNGKSALMHIWDLERDSGPENYMDSNLYIKKLIKAGANVNEKDMDGKTPLMYAVYPESVQYLIAAGADVNAKDKNGMTPLMYAEFPESMQMLINAGADAKAKDNDGMTAFMYAFTRQYLPCHDSFEGPSEVIKLFKKAGADIDAKDNQGFSLKDHINNACSNASNMRECEPNCVKQLDGYIEDCKLSSDDQEGQWKEHFKCVEKRSEQWKHCENECKQSHNRLDWLIGEYGERICNIETIETLPEVKAT